MKIKTKKINEKIKVTFYIRKKESNYSIFNLEKNKTEDLKTLALADKNKIEKWLLDFEKKEQKLQLAKNKRLNLQIAKIKKVFKNKINIEVKIQYLADKRLYFYWEKIFNKKIEMIYFDEAQKTNSTYLTFEFKDGEECKLAFGNHYVYYQFGGFNDGKRAIFKLEPGEIEIDNKYTYDSGNNDYIKLGVKYKKAKIEDIYKMVEIWQKEKDYLH